MARQFVSHGHVFINGKKVNIPSYEVKVDDIISISATIQKNPQIIELLNDKERKLLPFIKKEGVSGKLIRMPKKEDLEVPVA